MKNGMMRIENLSSYGLPEVVVRSWREQLGEELLPLQRRAVIESRILEGRNVLICAPTSSGKTFCGELAATAAIFNRRKAIFLVPLKSIAEERYREFSRRYKELGIRVVIATGDHREFENDLASGKYDLGIVVYEKFNQLLVKNLDLLASVGLIVIDEVQMLGDPERGATLELALLKIMRSDYSPQIVALSAVLANADELAGWLGCSLLKDDYRPVELRHGVLHQGLYRYHCAGGYADGEEQLSTYRADDPQELLLKNIADLVNSGEQVLVFLKAKRACEMLAMRLAEENNWAEAASTVERINRESATLLGRRLVQTLRVGVAFHHAGLSHRQRAILERGFLSKEINVLVSTTTLAMGVNLPAQSVFIDCYKFQNGKHGQHAVVTPLGWGDYEAMSGRAGRYGRDAKFGRSVLIAGSEIEAETLWNSYVEGHAAMVKSALHNLALPEVILDLISSKAVAKGDELAAALERSFYASGEVVYDAPSISEALNSLREHSLIFESGGKIEASPIGRLASLHGISSTSMSRMAALLKEYRGCDTLSWLFAVSRLSEFSVAGIYLGANEDYGSLYREWLVEYVGHHPDAARWLTSLSDPLYMLTDVELLSLKCAFLLSQWIGSTETIELEIRFRTHVGSMLQLAETAAWLIDTLAEVAEIVHHSENQTEKLRALAEAVRKGFDLPDSIYSVGELSADERDLVWRLFEAGWTSCGQFTSERRAKLAALVGENAADRLIEKFGSLQITDGIDATNKEETMPVLKLHGKLAGERVGVVFNETLIELTPKSFNYLYKLGAARFLKPEGWMSKDEIEPGFNQAKNFYRVKQELKKFATGLEEKIENNKSGFYRLNLRPEQIKIDVESMRSYSDFELAELTRKLATVEVV